MNIIDVKNVSYSYKTKYQTINAVNGVNCEFELGKFYALIGKSGSGKTTLLSMLAGLEKPASGEINVNGKSIDSMNINIYRRKKVSVIYQNYNLFPLMTVEENVVYPMILNKIKKKDAISKARECLNKVGLNEIYWKRLPSMLSGGEQQRVAISRTLANDAKIVLADEPTGNLDGENSRQIVDFLRKLATEDGKCVIVVTHDTDIAGVADVVYRMDSGMLVQDNME